MEILVYTITYNRLELTKKYLGSLKKHTDVKFDHIIFDNGSTDGTIEWLKANNYNVIEFGENLGITGAQNEGLEFVYKNYDLIIKFDNDCEVVTENILEKIIRFYSFGGSDDYILSPVDLKLDKDYKPEVLSTESFDYFDLELTTHNGGMFRCVPKKAMDLMINSDVRLDANEGKVWRDNGFKVGYFKDLKVIHQGLNKGSKDYKF